MRAFASFCTVFIPCSSVSSAAALARFSDRKIVMKLMNTLDDLENRLWSERGLDDIHHLELAATNVERFNCFRAIRPHGPERRNGFLLRKTVLKESQGSQKRKCLVLLKPILHSASRSASRIEGVS